MRLTDPWFEATFLKNTTAKGHKETGGLEGRTLRSSPPTWSQRVSVG